MWWFRRRFRLASPDAPPGAGVSGDDVVRYLERALRGPPSAELQTALTRFKGLPPAKQDCELPGVYLLLERELATSGTRAEIRAEAERIIAAHFPALRQRADLALVFAPPGQQERLLCQRLLADTLAHAAALMGAAGSDLLGSLAAWINAVPCAPMPVPFDLRPTLPSHESEWVALFFRFARELYLYLEKRLGESCARSFFERSYDDLAHRYARLETFPVIVHLLPEKLIDSEKLGRLSRSQIQKVLLKKVAELNDINTKQEAQYQELDAVRRQLVAARDELEERVQARTAALRVANEKLTAAKERAELADRAKTEFLANMSHELRTPLNAVIGFSEIIRDAIMGPLDARYRDYAKEICNSGRHLLEVINDILDLSKIEAGRLELRDEIVSVAEVAETCRRIVTPKADSAGISVSVSLPSDLPAIRADETRLKQIFLNLLSNAIKFTPAGGSLNVSAAADLSGELAITIADTGIGMRPEDIPVALEPFRQVDSTLSRRSEGTGLGLPLVKRLTELHGGRLEIDSAPGRGTTVRVILPVDRIVGLAA